MSAKHGSKRTRKDAPPAPSPAPEPAPTTVPGHPAVAAAGGGNISWLDSPDPRRRAWGQALLVGIWIYVAALWLLALDQTFDWGIFGPEIPAEVK